MSLASGASATYGVKLVAGPDRRSGLLAALALSGTQDPNHHNNITVAVTKVQ